MKIALLAPPYLPVPPIGYGGTEKIVGLLTDGLVDRGHDVTLFAAGDSKTKAHLAALVPTSLGNSGFLKEDHASILALYEKCFDRTDEFDILHSHVQYLGLDFAARVHTPVVHTWHGSFYPGEVPEEKRDMLRAHADAAIVTISNNQREGLSGLNYVKTVYNSIDMDQFSFVQNPQGHYLLWVGRISDKKGPLDAIGAAKKLGMPLKLAAAIDPLEATYFKTMILPHIDGSSVELLGEQSMSALSALYGNAYATLFPSLWHEPFGLVMIESMVTGTPVIAYNRGSVSEIVNDRLTGYVVDPQEGVDGLVKGIQKLDALSKDAYVAMRAACRKHVEDNFTVKTMVDGYEAVYESLIAHR